MIYLFVHQNFPGQYKHIVRYLAERSENKVYFITQEQQNWINDVTKLTYRPEIPSNISCHPFVLEYDIAVRVGLAVAQVCLSLRQQGIVPDLVVGHSGWGETLYIKDVFPDSPLLAYFEFFYHIGNVDVGFDPEFLPLSDSFRVRAKNAVNLIAFDSADWGNTPTHWQKSLYPPEMRSRITVIHEGVDIKVVQPYPAAWLHLARDNKILTRKDEVITYVARSLEPYRGFHIFMRAAREILRRRPKAQIVIVGGDKVSYGVPPPDGSENYRMMMLAELGPSLAVDRVHFLNQIPYEVYLNLLQVSSAHVYLTYPFVLSWSFIEAMACGCAVIGSDTPPVLEVVKDGENGLIVDFFSPEDIADKVDQILDDPSRAEFLRHGARQTAVSKFDLRGQLLPRWIKLFDDLVHGRRPAVEIE